MSFGEGEAPAEPRHSQELRLGRSLALPMDQLSLLNDALVKARHLLDDLRRQQSQLSQPCATMSREVLADGQEALADAVAAAERTVEALLTALNQQEKQV